MIFLTTRILLVLALLMNGVMVAHASVPVLLTDTDTDVVVMAEEPACHEAAADSESPEDKGAMPCCQAGHCHCLVMQMTGVESSPVLQVLASPVPVAATISYLSPVSPLMLRPPIA